MTTARKSPRAWGILLFNNSSGTTGTASRSSSLALQQQGGGAGAATTSPANPGLPRRSGSAATGRYTNNDHNSERAGHDLAAHGDLERHCGAPWFS